MIPLIEYINQNDYGNSLIDKHFELHSKILSNLKRTIDINETHGTYDGQIKFIKVLAKTIYVNYVKNKLDGFTITNDKLNKFDNIFFSKLHIIYKEGAQTGYLSKNNFNEKTKLFDEVLISIDADEYSEYNDILLCLTHELTHAWEDYQRVLNNKLSIRGYDDDDYEDYITDMDDVNSPKAVYNRLKYMLDKSEINAYVSELRSIIETNKPKTPKEAIDLLKQSETYQTYIIFNTLVRDKKIQDIDKYYNKDHKTTYTTDKVIKILSNKIIKIINKITSVYPKMYFDYVESQSIKEGLILHKSNKPFLELQKLINE